MERIDHVAIGSRSTQCTIVLETTSGDEVQPRDDLQGSALPGVDHPGQRSRHRKGRRDSASHRRVVRAGADDIEGDLGALEGRGVARSDER